MLPLFIVFFALAGHNLGHAEALPQLSEIFTELNQQWDYCQTLWAGGCQTGEECATTFCHDCGQWLGGAGKACCAQPTIAACFYNHGPGSLSISASAPITSPLSSTNPSSSADLVGKLSTSTKTSSVFTPTTSSTPSVSTGAGSTKSTILSQENHYIFGFLSAFAIGIAGLAWYL